MRDFVYGGVDGAITTLAVVTGVWGAQLPVKTVVILGIANLLADGFSMAAGNYLSSRSEQERERRLEAVEREHIERFPEGEREEIRQICGVQGESVNYVLFSYTVARQL